MTRQAYDGRTTSWFGHQRPTRSGESTRNESAGCTTEKGKKLNIDAMLNSTCVTLNMIFQLMQEQILTDEIQELNRKVFFPEKTLVVLCHNFL